MNIRQIFGRTAEVITTWYAGEIPREISEGTSWWISGLINCETSGRDHNELSAIIPECIFGAIPERKCGWVLHGIHMKKPGRKTGNFDAGTLGRILAGFSGKTFVDFLGRIFRKIGERYKIIIAKTGIFFPLDIIGDISDEMLKHILK